MTDAPSCFDCKQAHTCDQAWKYFDCPGCGRRVPWCYGAADDMPELCDGCWYQVCVLRDEARRQGNGRDEPEL